MSADQFKIAILMGSQSDWPIMKRAQAVLAELGVASDARVISAHRKPARLHEFIDEAEAAGVQVFIAGAGLAAHLPGVVASLTIRPVLGVPLESGPLKGQDALYSIVQMPGGIPVGTLGIGGAGAKNAGLLAAEILALSDDDLAARLKDWRANQAASLKEIPQD
jgi:5-(carboxyamino)imidazole ribonucleotide mutase